MDLSGYSLQQIPRDKRERQPNWTEPEKQLLLSLTQVYQKILENKGNDSMTIMQKSVAWDEITRSMKEAGYNRSKVRLKQQLGRIRAAETKKIKDEVEKNITMSEIAANSSTHNVPNNNLSINVVSGETIKQPDENNNPNVQIPPMTKIIPLPIHELVKIKPKVSTNSSEVSINTKELLPTSISNSSGGVGGGCGGSAMLLACPSNMPNIKMVDQMRYMLKNIQTMNEINNISNNSNNIVEQTNNNNVVQEIPRSPVTPTTIASTITTNTVTSTMTTTAASISSTSTNIQQQRKGRICRMRLNSIRTPSTRERRLRQIHSLRIAVERKRLYNIHLQQKRDRILYRKDVEIQNLKLQILRNLANQNRNGNFDHI